MIRPMAADVSAPFEHRGKWALAQPSIAETVVFGYFFRSLEVATAMTRPWSPQAQ